MNALRLNHTGPILPLRDHPLSSDTPRHIATKVGSKLIAAAFYTRALMNVLSSTSLPS